MSYSDFTELKQFNNKFDINIKFINLFNKINVIEPSDWLKTSLQYRVYLHSTNEKSKSETIVQPILNELVRLNKDFITLYSGETLKADVSKGLTGECDFVITKGFKYFSIDSPIFQIVEAKRHDIDSGIAQCAAQMRGAQIFNKKENSDIKCIHGCVTTGDNWRFLKLDDELFIDNKIYYLDSVDKILGIFQSIVDYYR